MQRSKTKECPKDQKACFLESYEVRLFEVSKKPQTRRFRYETELSWTVRMTGQSDPDGEDPSSLARIELGEFVELKTKEKT